MNFNVCFLVEDFYPVSHGSTTQIMLWSRRLAQHGNAVTVLTRRISKDHPKTERIQGYNIVRVPPVCGMSRYGKYLMMLPALWVLIQRRKEFDVILVSDFKVLGIVGVVGASLLRKFCILRGSTCGEMDGSYAYMFEGETSPARQAVIRFLARSRNIVLKRADYFLSICSPIKQELMACGVPTRKILELANGIDTTLYAPIKCSEKATLKRKLRLLTPSKRFLKVLGPKRMANATLERDFPDKKWGLFKSSAASRRARCLSYSLVFPWISFEFLLYRRRPVERVPREIEHMKE